MSIYLSEKIWQMTLDFKGKRKFLFFQIMLVNNIERQLQEVYAEKNQIYFVDILL